MLRLRSVLVDLQAPKAIRVESNEVVRFEVELDVAWVPALRSNATLHDAPEVIYRVQVRTPESLRSGMGEEFSRPIHPLLVISYWDDQALLRLLTEMVERCSLASWEESDVRLRRLFESEYG
jgi:hypothetical protein